jgi:2-polyprenyl-3-methyl-5-hydroxy-6-metoxy-1,4-benzoquinol methylase
MPGAAPTPASPSYDYAQIPVGFYDTVLRSGNPIRRLWHLSKFERVLDCLPPTGMRSLLDVGCFAGSFLSLVPESQFPCQVGVDILAPQIEYARAHYGTAYRRFHHVAGVADLDGVEGEFDCITLIEVIEHLTPEEVRVLLDRLSRKLVPGGRLVITTPNYASTWPLLELLLDRLSEVTYREQHITRFTWFNMEKRLADLYPPFHRELAVEFKTTTHLLTPFLAGVSFSLAHALSRVIPHRRWRQPFGNLLLLVARRRTRVHG